MERNVNEIYIFMNIYISLTSIYQTQQLLLNTLNSIKTQNLFIFNI